ncbi:hypothetical protein K466DRAFT_198897 [Polyporus arcularius HHB13444]|uniref:Uncharacterized protein n=1 Tax=Polyporus arcularius HHB13444 TaxID=1314778 RepID=A0A5C3P8H3_9APHY|nr:hypothetical protein K466DRAFT_198897 [Polyporus arcularius HHB13444]
MVQNLLCRQAWRAHSADVRPSVPNLRMIDRTSMWQSTELMDSRALYAHVLPPLHGSIHYGATVHPSRRSCNRPATPTRSRRVPCVSREVREHMVRIPPQVCLRAPPLLIAERQRFTPGTHALAGMGTSDVCERQMPRHASIWSQLPAPVT